MHTYPKDTLRDTFDPTKCLYTYIHKLEDHTKKIRLISKISNEKIFNKIELNFFQENPLKKVK